MPAKLQRWSILLLMLVLAGSWAGCSSIEPENETARPWNEPKTWETGMPPGMTQGR